MLSMNKNAREKLDRSSGQQLVLASPNASQADILSWCDEIGSTVLPVQYCCQKTTVNCVPTTTTKFIG